MTHDREELFERAEELRRAGRRDGALGFYEEHIGPQQENIKRNEAQLLRMQAQQSHLEGALVRVTNDIRAKQSLIDQELGKLAALLAI